MVKPPNKKPPSPIKLVRRVLRQYLPTKPCNESEDTKSQMDQASLTKENESLKDQISSLKLTIKNLQAENENKDVNVAKIAREKEKLTLDLLKTKRTNSNLVQQMEEERKFYYKEKEVYCREMNEYKKLKKVLSNSNISTRIDSEEENEKLRKTLEKTLHTNYNLSIKFLKMKETKTTLSKCLKKTEEEHKRVVNDLRVKIEDLSREMNDILNQKFNLPISPSNKKYLKLVNQNSSLIYENLCLQNQVDQLHLVIKNNKHQRTKSESNLRSNRNRREKYRKPRESPKVIKLFEREKKPGIPTLQILDEKEVHKKHNSVGKLKLPPKNESQLTVFQVSTLQSPTSSVASSLIRKRSKSAPKIVQSVSFQDQSRTIDSCSTLSTRLK